MKKIKHKPVSSKTEKKQVSLLPEFLKEQRTRILLGIALALVSLYILFALIGFFFSGGIDQSLVDGPWGKIITNPEIEVSNPAGKIGAWISDLLINRWFGISSFILCYLLLLCSFRLGSIKVKNFSRRLFIGMCIILWISLFLGFLSESISNLFEVGTGYLFPGGGTVLPGVTRDSLIHILRDWGYKVNETHLSIDDLMKAGHDGTLEEAFGTGTAAVVSPVGEFVYKDDSVIVNDFKIGELTQKLYDTLTGIQWGKLEDKYGWTTPVE